MNQAQHFLGQKDCLQAKKNGTSKCESVSVKLVIAHEYSCNDDLSSTCVSISKDVAEEKGGRANDGVVLFYKCLYWHVVPCDKGCLLH